MNESSPTVGRRSVLRGAALAGAVVVAGPVLAACGSDQPAGADPTPAGTAPDPGASGGASAEVLVATDKVPEGGGIILSDPQVVVTQPTAGVFAAFSSICTHQGCPVADVADGTINCNCHGSKFSVEDGSVVSGPAPSPLPPVGVTVDGDSVVRA